MEVQPGTYSTALTITITIGVSLLILNMLLFFGLYYHMDRRKEGSANNRQGSKNPDTANENDGGSDHCSHYRNAHNPQLDNQQYQLKGRHRNTVTFNEVWTSNFEFLVLTSIELSTN